MRSRELARRVGQLLWVGFDGHELPTDLRRRITEGHVGAAILFSRNVASVEQTRALVATLHDAAPPSGPPLLVAVDQEGGSVQRIREPATVWPAMMSLGERAATSPQAADAAEALAARVGEALGLELAALGFDVDFAPVLDVHTNPANPVIGRRAFATSPEQVARLAGAFARGLDRAGLLACGKHFPGHGDTALDSHLALPRVDHPASRLRAVEIAPFAARRELPLLMTAHVVYSALDPEWPATLSARIVDGILRRELGYTGVVVSDDMEMKAIADHFGLEDAIVRSLAAGCDAFLFCHREDLQIRAFEALLRAAEGRAEVRDRLAESAARVETLKARHVGRERPRPGLEVLGCPTHRALAAAMRSG